MQESKHSPKAESPGAAKHWMSGVKQAGGSRGAGQASPGRSNVPDPAAEKCSPGHMAASLFIK